MQDTVRIIITEAGYGNHSTRSLSQAGCGLSPVAVAASQRCLSLRESRFLDNFKVP